MVLDILLMEPMKKLIKEQLIKKQNLKLRKSLNKKFEDLSDAKLPELASELIKTIAKAGVQPQLIPEEGEYLYESINNFIKAIEKRGI